MKLFVIQRINAYWRNNQSQAILEKLAILNQWGQLNYSETGKPFIENGYISVSHSNNLLVIAHHTIEIGLDCEYIRPLSNALIQKLQLDSINPLLDWCKREAIIKLLDDKTYVLKKELIDFHFTEITLDSNFCIVLASKYLVDTYDVIYLDENLTITTPIQ